MLRKQLQKGHLCVPYRIEIQKLARMSPPAPACITTDLQDYEINDDGLFQSCNAVGDKLSLLEFITEVR